MSVVAPRVAVFGHSDRERLVDALSSRIVRAELTRRLARVQITSFASEGWRRPSRFDAGEPAEPWGPWGSDDVARFVAEFDVAIVEAGATADAPVSVLRDAGIEVLEAPDGLALAARTAAPDVLARRLGYLQWVSWFPALRPVRCFDACLGADDAALDVALRAAVADRVAVAVIEPDPADTPPGAPGRVVRALTKAGVAFTMTDGPTGIEDLVAMLATADRYVGPSLGAAAVAESFGRGTGPIEDAPVDAIDRSFDELARRIRASVLARSGVADAVSVLASALDASEARLAAALRAKAALEQRLSEERLVAAQSRAGFEAGLESVVAELAVEIRLREERIADLALRQRRLAGRMVAHLGVATPSGAAGESAIVEPGP